ncbi:MAG TPA: S8 family serine peptidase [Candidatus Krumholzibacteria bacterium]|nr:S8 family serine peptidase [Candidatus Krumholzibacteria bacterium]
MRFAPNATETEIVQFERSSRLWPTARLKRNATGYREFNYSIDRDPLAVLAVVVAEPVVSDACLDTQVKFFGDAYYEHQWNLQKMRMERAWEITRGDPALTIAIIDDGIDYWHEDLTVGMWWNPNDVFGDHVDGDDDSLWYGSPMIDDFTGWDFRNNDNQPLPDTMCVGNPIHCSGDRGRHGTAVAGIAMAICDNDSGIAGACGSRGVDGPKFMTIRVYSQAASTVASAVEYAWRKGATVINMSFGIYNEPGDAVAAQLDQAAAHGVIVVAAVGNDGEKGYPQSHVHFPALYPSVIAVGATDQNDVRWSYSCMGSELDVVAPSGRYGFTELWTTDNDPPLAGDFNPTICPGGCPPENTKYFSRFAGTSVSSPEVASIAILLKSHMPDLTPAQVKERLIESAVDLGEAGPDTLYGYGRVDAYRALTEWGTISGNVTWSPSDTHDGTRYISGDLTIASGATLTIMPGTIIKIANDDDLRTGSDTLRVEINVQGTLIAEGTSANPVVFESWHPQGTDDWAGIYLDDQSGGGTFDHCSISRAETAIETYVPVTISDCVIDSCSFAGVDVQDGLAMIERNTLTGPGVYGIRVVADSVVVRDTSVNGASGTALQVETDAGALVRGSQFLNSDKGTYHSGHFHHVDIDSSCVFSGNTIGVHLYQTVGAANLRNSTISNNTNTGVVCDEASGLIENNLIESSSTGINCGNEATPTIEGNTIKLNANGVIAAFDANPFLGLSPESGNNTFALSSSYHVRNYTSTTIYAENNCWNVNTGTCAPKAAKIAGDVDVDYPQCCTVSSSMLVQLDPKETPKKVATGIKSIVPNPFNPQTTIYYGLASSGAVEIRVFDVGGRLVRELVNGVKNAGVHQVVWDGTDRRGSPTASGIYFVRMVAGGKSFTRKMVLLK